MTPAEQTNAFSDDLDRLIDRYRAEFELTYATTIGVLFTKATLLVQEAAESQQETDQ